MSTPYILTVPMTQSARENALAVEAIREWCDRTERESARQPLTDEIAAAVFRTAREVRALLPEATE